MEFVIQNTRNGTYLDHRFQWRTDVANAMTFKSSGAVTNYLQHTYRPWLRKHPMAPGEKELQPVPLRSTEEKAALTEEAVENFTDKLASQTDAERMRSQFEDLRDIYASLLKYAEDEKLDVLHKIELEEKMDAAQRASLFKRLREVLKYRRQCKDMCEYLRQYEQSGILEANAKLEAMNKAFAEYLQKRNYTPRILTELFQNSPAQRRRDNGQTVEIGQ